MKKGSLNFHSNIYMYIVRHFSIRIAQQHKLIFTITYHNTRKKYVLKLQSYSEPKSNGSKLTRFINTLFIKNK